ncbi:MAG TPA: Asp-tRNA(Asn)/Glu-tRNA(Gln) amidotransferase subunit GatB [Patescibacteria group bacterium]|nr:Asp-tRNA(Asn)/Glu-tRNA(Gln) amidotransferase subunit GatB [Patescibacteria group bacterium]
MDKYLIAGKYYPTVGIECHVQLNTRTKLFAAVDNDARSAKPNSLISPLCVGMPGTLPVLNAEAVNLTIRAGLALRAEIAEISHFDRKHYFYPDLPKGYQISQYDRPIVGKGVVEILMDDGSVTKVRITRAHLEEDAGKTTHPAGGDYSLVDFNRTGTPLLEIVSEPDIHSAAEARAFAHELYLIMKYAAVSDVDLYHGNMRFDVNVSVSSDLKKLGTRSETKNLNSFRSVEKAVDFEIKRQIAMLEKGKNIKQETRGWDAAKQKTTSQRSKEEAHDYRYFPDPDIPPINITKAMIAKAAEEMPLLPMALRERFGSIGLDSAQIDTILEEPILAEIIRYLTEAHDLKTTRTIANWCLGELQRLSVTGAITWPQVKQSLDYLIELAAMVDGGDLSSSAAKAVLSIVVNKNTDPRKVAVELGFLQVSDEGELALIIEQVLGENQKAADDVRQGQTKAIGFLVGQVMKNSGGRANPKIVENLIKKQLGVNQ